MSEGNILSKDTGQRPASLLKMLTLPQVFFLQHFASKNQLPDLFKWNIGWKWVNVCLKIPFTKNVDSLETSQLFCIVDHLTGFCIIRVLTERFFLTKYSKFFNIPKSVSGIDLFRYEFKLVIFFPFEVLCPVRHVRNTPFSFPAA